MQNQPIIITEMNVLKDFCLTFIEFISWEINREEALNPFVKNTVDSLKSGGAFFHLPFPVRW